MGVDCAQTDELHIHVCSSGSLHLSLTCNSNDITQDTSEKFLVSIWVNDKNDSIHVVKSELEIFW